MEDLRDAFDLFPKITEESYDGGNFVECLDKGYVELVDCSPRMIPKDRTLEFAIVRAARTSFGLGLKSKKEDDALVHYLITNSHTSPLEFVDFTFHIKCPKFVAIQLLRHRTAKINEFSQRYAEVEEDDFFYPSAPDMEIQGIRLANKEGNKQGSTSSEKVDDKIKDLISEAEGNCQIMFGNYHDLIQLGVAKEVSRFCLPMATYTKLYYKMDLNNLFKFLKLRMDRDHAQAEIVVYADAMFKLIQHLVPVACQSFINTHLESVNLTKEESEAIKNRELPKFSSRNMTIFMKKIERLGLTDIYKK